MLITVILHEVEKVGKVCIAHAEEFQHQKLLGKLLIFLKKILFCEADQTLVIRFLLLKIIRETDEEKWHFDQFILKMETSQRAVTVVAMRWCIFFPRAGKLSWAPVLTSNGLISKDEDLKQMRMNALKGWFQQMMPAQWISLTHLTPCLPDKWEFSEHLVQGTISLETPETLIFSSLSLYRYPFLGTYSSPDFFFFFLNHHLCFSTLSGDVMMFRFILTLFKLGCFLMILISTINSLHSGHFFIAFRS